MDLIKQFSARPCGFWTKFDPNLKSQKYTQCLISHFLNHTKEILYNNQILYPQIPLVIN